MLPRIRKTASRAARNIYHGFSLFHSHQAARNVGEYYNVLQNEVTDVLNNESGRKYNSALKENLINQYVNLQQQIYNARIATITGTLKFEDDFVNTPTGQLLAHAAFLATQENSVARTIQELEAMHSNQEDAEFILETCMQKYTIIKNSCEEEHEYYCKKYLDEKVDSSFENWSWAESDSADDTQSLGREDRGPRRC